MGLDMVQTHRGSVPCRAVSFRDHCRRHVRCYGMGCHAVCDLLQTSRSILHQSMVQKAGNKVGHIAVCEPLISRHCHNKEGVDHFEKIDTSLINLSIE